ncbi:aminoacyl-tRNA hydrolase [Candidatus Bandiella numerosa]|uniref:aminoacyl-tRNA hydrolase n=1 Tax=Candidatus Bandiella numerosa TaxID=2570586 RepID=UPI001EFFFCC9|nr:aminoacyl-tRNA hydrolase [Candidatus Bandiella numerosa]
MKLVIGLGNPGFKYKETRHNLGFNAIEVLAKKFKISEFQDKFDGKIAKATIFNQDIIFFLPMTFMNNSGIPISKVVNFYKIPLSDIFIIFDDLDLVVGKIKIKIGGRDAGHNGLKSIDSYVGKNYNKIKIGIGRPALAAMVTNYVLNKFDESEFYQINTILNFLAENLNLILSEQHEKFLNLYHSNQAQLKQSVAKELSK